MSKEYINRELLENALEDENKNGNFVFTANWIMEIVDNLPAANVVPKSEYDELLKAYAVYGETTGLKQAKTGVAREIFEEVEALRLKHIYGEIDGVDLNIGLYELKRKYTEENV